MKKALQVSLDVREPSMVELSVGDRVQLDRVVRSERGCVAEREQLLQPGLATVALAAGSYAFRTLTDASLRVVAGGVEWRASTQDKDGGFPDQTLDARGDEPSGDQPRFTVS